MTLSLNVRNQCPNRAIGLDGLDLMVIYNKNYASNESMEVQNASVRLLNEF